MTPAHPGNLEQKDTRADTNQSVRSPPSVEQRVLYLAARSAPGDAIDHTTYRRLTAYPRLLTPTIADRAALDRVLDLLEGSAANHLDALLEPLLPTRSATTEATATESYGSLALDRHQLSRAAFQDAYRAAIERQTAAMVADPSVETRTAALAAIAALGEELGAGLEWYDRDGATSDDTSTVPCPEPVAVPSSDLVRLNGERRRQRLAAADRSLDTLPPALFPPPPPGADRSDAAFITDRAGIRFELAPEPRESADADPAVALFRLELTNHTLLPATWSPETEACDRLVLRTAADPQRAYPLHPVEGGVFTEARLAPGARESILLRPEQAGIALSAVELGGRPLTRCMWTDDEPVPTETILRFTWPVPIPESSADAEPAIIEWLTLPRGLLVRSSNEPAPGRPSDVRFVTTTECIAPVRAGVGYARAIHVRSADADDTDGFIARGRLDAVVEDQPAFIVGAVPEGLAVENTLAAYDPRRRPVSTVAGTRTGSVEPYQPCCTEHWGLVDPVMVGCPHTDTVLIASGGRVCLLEPTGDLATVIETGSPIVAVAEPLVVASGRVIQSLTPAGDPAWQATFDEAVAALARIGRRLMVATATRLAVLDDETGAVTHALPVRGTRTLIGGRRVGLITDGVQSMTVIDGEGRNYRTAMLPFGRLTAAAFAEDGRRILVGATDARVHVYNRSLDEEWTATLESMPTALWADERMCVVGCADGTVHWFSGGGDPLGDYRPSTSDETAIEQGPRTPTSAAPIVALVSMRDHLVAGTKDGLLLWFERSGRGGR